MKEVFYMKCNNCGIILNIGQTKCPNCGYEVDVEKQEMNNLSRSSLPQNEEVEVIQEDGNSSTNEIIEENIVSEEAPINNMDDYIHQIQQDPSEKEIPVVIRKKKNIMPIIIAIILIVIVIFGYMYISKPKTRFLTASNNSYKQLIEKLDNITQNDIYSLAKDNVVSLDYDAKVNLQIDNDQMGLSQQLDALNFKMKLTEDQKTNQSFISLLLNQNNNELMGLDLLLTENKTYIKINDVLEQFVWTKAKNKSLLEKISDEDYKYLGSLIKDSIFRELKDDYFTNSKAILNLDNEDKTFTKISLNVTNKLLRDISVEILTRIKNDNKSLEILAKYNLIDNKSLTEVKKELKGNIEEAINSLNKEKPTNDSVMVYSIYVKGYNNVVKYQVQIPTINGSDKSENEISFLNYNNEENKMVKEIEFKTNKVSFLTVTATETKTDNYKVKGIISGLGTISGIYSEDKDTTSVNLNLKSLLDESEYSLNIITQQKELEKNKKYSNDINFELTSSSYNVENMKFILNIASKFAVEKEFPKTKISDAKSIDDLTEEENTKINEKMMQLPIINMFMVPTMPKTIYDQTYNPSDM
jgi:uncharacterized Zn finger protein (UPF0148 family)